MKLSPLSNLMRLVLFCIFLNGCSADNPSTAPISSPCVAVESSEPDLQAARIFTSTLLLEIKNSSHRQDAERSKSLKKILDSYIHPDESIAIAASKLRTSCFLVYERSDSTKRPQEWFYPGEAHAEMLGVNSGGIFRGDIHIDIFQVSDHGRTKVNAVIRFHSLTP